MNGTVQNSALGFFGFCFRIPAGFELYNSAVKNPAEYSELQQMAIRIYDFNRQYHPRGNELFYGSFLLMSDKTCFLLIMKSEPYVRFDESPFSDEINMPQELMLLYNITSRHSFTIGAGRLSAVYTRGSAYEKNGWYYSGPKHQGVGSAMKPAKSSAETATAMSSWVLHCRRTSRI